MTPEQFITLWKDNKLSERGGAQGHFDDLCDLLGVDKPRDPENYCFERGAKKAGGGDGWADVWKRGYFGWENKKPGRDLKAALKQLSDYALQLDNPPLLVVSDRERIIIHTAFTGFPDQPREIRIEELTDPSTRQVLRWVFTEPEKLRPEKSTAAITGEAAGQFAGLAQAMRERGLGGQQVAHFLVQCLFCMFAEDEDLLPGSVFTEILKNAGGDAAKAASRINRLFTAMQQKTGGEYGDHDIAWFNGGLFKTIDIPALIPADLAALHAAAGMDWRAIDPTIFGTLFERSLDPSARAPLGAHYTDTATIAKLIHPLISEPLLTEWQGVKAVIGAGMGKGERTKAYKQAHTAFQGFLARLNRFRVLDPACGSGNFLYLALKALRDVERQVLREGYELGGFQPGLWMQTGPNNILGLEINEYAAELARTTVWIGDIQWCRRNGRDIVRNPILRSLDSIEHRDALLEIPPNPPLLKGGATAGSGGICEAIWPKADVIVGNPPFLGGSKKRGELGGDYFDALAKCYGDRVPPGADLVCYWFEKARAQIEAGHCAAAGLVATNSIRGGANRKVLERIAASTRIFSAWRDEEWVNEGAAVRVSLVAFGQGGNARLDGQPVASIHANLSATEGLDMTKAQRLPENTGTCFEGIKKYGPFDVPGQMARMWLSETGNPNGISNAKVLRPWINATDVVRNDSDTWVIDFTGLSESEASLFESPFDFAKKNVQPARTKDRNAKTRDLWWLYERPRLEMRKTIASLPRYIVTPIVAKHRIFAWRSAPTLAMNLLDVIARSDDTTFGILHSRFHELWSLGMCTWLGVGNDPRYTPTTTFETFPFPIGLTPADTAKGAPSGPAAEHIGAAARRLNELRENWLNPPEWVEWVISPEEEKAGFPKRPVAKPGHEADLKKRTLTNLYNLRPSWLDLAHRDLDAAVAQAYGWNDYTPEMEDETILSRLLALNLERAGL
ncbi:MAG: class I SAM-dependent DNA methyltransferase [Desulfobulbia bacterium]